MLLFDAVSDPGYQTVAERLRHIELPGYVKEADDDTLKQAGGNHGFAIARHRKLPCGTKAACYMSHAFYLTQRNSLSADLQNEADRNLARFANIHGITEDVSKLAQYMGPETVKAASAVTVARQLSYCGVEKQERQMPGELIRAARELVEGDKVARDASFCRRWCFDSPFQRLPKEIAMLKLANKDKTQCEQLNVLATKVAALSQTRQVRNMDSIADALYMIMGHKTAAQTWDMMKNWKRHEIADIRVGRKDIPYAELEPKLAEIKLLTGLPVTKGAVMTFPADNWVDVIEACSPDQARQIQSMCSLVAA